MFLLALRDHVRAVDAARLADPGTGVARLGTGHEVLGVFVLVFFLGTGGRHGKQASA